MRTQGKITAWNGDKGYGFITPSAGAKQVFVHISAFGNRSVPPQIGQLVTFSLSADKQGRPCAAAVTRVGDASPKRLKPKLRTGSFRTTVVALLLMSLAGAVAYTRYHKAQVETYSALPPPVASSALGQPNSAFHCDGRTHCSHMTSCAEATYFIQNCPNTRMDGDGDGVPCESQWCN